MNGNILLFSGPPRSGKSTIARKVAETVGLQYFSPGEQLKDLARNDNKPFHEYFNSMRDDDIRTLASLALECVHEGDLVLDGRYEPVICHEAGIPVPAIFVTAPSDVRAERLSKAENCPLGEAQKILDMRETKEIDVSKRLFGDDYRDKKFYIGSVDTGDLSPDQAYEAVMKLLSDKGLFKKRTAVMP